MHYYYTLLLCLAQWVFCVVARTGDETSAKKPDHFDFQDQPNFVVFLADDMGIGDLASYGNMAQEWNEIDQMASEGMRFTQVYAADSLCTPARSGFMTGRYPIRSGMVGGPRVLVPSSTGGLPLSELTIPEVLKTVGYRTGMVGKWHLGINAYNSSDGSHLPKNHGFDYVGVNLPMSNNWNCDESGVFQKNGPDPKQCFLYESDRIIQQPFAHQNLTIMLLDGFRQFLKTTANRQPFFFYFSFPQVHDSLFSDQTRFAKSSKRGNYGGDLNEMAWAVGESLKLLRAYGVSKRTLSVFLSDHGPHKELCTLGGTAGQLKGGKANWFEGGFRIPFITHWPGKISNVGEVSHTVLSSMDILPTFAALAGARLPNNLLLDGLNMAPAFLGTQKKDDNKRPIFFYCNRRIMAVRYGNYKTHFTTVRLFDDVQAQSTCPGGIPLSDFYVSQRCPENETETLEWPLIYNLSVDPGEDFPIAGDEYIHNLGIAKALVMRHQDKVEAVPEQLAVQDEKVRPCCNPPACTCNYKGIGSSV